MNESLKCKPLLIFSCPFEPREWLIFLSISQEKISNMLHSRNRLDPISLASPH
jgi:hypothetical protein